MTSYQRRKEQEQSGSAQQHSTSQSSTSPAPQKREGLLGWFQDTGDWIAERYDSTSAAVSEWASDVYDSAENAVDAVSETLSEAKDVWDSTSISKEDGVWSLSTDLDEIADLLPVEMLSLDKEASDNQVTMEIDRQRGEVRLKTSSLAVSQLNVSGLSISAAQLNDVEIIVKNAQVHLPVLGEVSIGSSDAKAKKSASINIGSVKGSNAVYGEGAEAIKASMLELKNVQIYSEMGGESFGMQPQNARFSVGEAKVVGLDSSTLSGNMSLSDATGTLDQSSSSAQFSAGSVLGSNLSRDGLAIDNTELQGLQGNIAAGENGHVANVSARQATVSGVNVGSSNGSTEESSDSSSPLDLNLTVDQAIVNDLDTDVVDANQVSLDGFSFTQNNSGMQISASKGSASGIDTSVVDADNLDINDLRFSQNDRGLQLSASNGTVSGLDTEAVDAKQLSLSDLSYAQDSNGLQVSTSGASASGIDSAIVDADSLSLGNTAVEYQNDGSSSLRLDQITATGLSAQDHRLAQLSGSSINASTSADGSATGSLGNLSYEGYQSKLGSSQSGSINNLEASGNIKTQEGQASLGSVNLGATNILGTQVASASLHNAQADHSVDGSNATLSSFSAQGIQNQYGSAESIQGTDLSTREKDGFAGSLGQLKVNSARGFGAEAEQITLNELSGSADSELTNAEFALSNLNVQNASNEIGYLETVNLNNLQGTKSGQNASASLSDFEMLNSGLHGIGSTDSVRATGLSLHSDGTTHHANMGAMKASNIRENNFGATVQEANLKGVSFSGSGLSNMSSAVESGDIHNAAMQGALLEYGSISGGQAQFKDGTGSGTLQAIDFRNASYGDLLSAESGQARNLTASGTFEEQTGSVDSVRLDGMSANMPQLRGSLDSASLLGGSFHHTGGGHGSLGIDQVKANNAQFEMQHAQSTGQSFNENSTPVNMDIDTNRLIQTGASRIDSADIQASVNMTAGKYGDGMAGFKIKDGTQMDANVAIRNNRIQDGTTIGTNRSIDTALWTSTDGVYVKDNRMMADVNGWFDINASEKANDAMGLDGKGLHSIGDYATAMTNLPSSDGGSGSGESMGNPIDMNSMSASGNIALSDGLIDAGGASARLAGAGQGANKFNFEAQANRISMAFAQLLSSSLAIKTDQGNISTGTASITDGEVSLQPNDMNATGSIGSVSVDSIQASR